MKMISTNPPFPVNPVVVIMHPTKITAAIALRKYFDAFSDFFYGLGKVSVARGRYPRLFNLSLKPDFSCVYQSVHVLIQSPISKLLELDPVVIAA